MSEPQLLTLTADALRLSLALAAPALAAGWLAGLLAGLAQSAAHIQEPALAFIPRVLAVTAALSLSATAIRDQLVAFFGELFVAMG